MRVVIINKSDTKGGAAVVSFRLMEALRREGVDARMLVVEKLSDSPFVEKAAGSFSINFHFILERLGIFIANGFNKSTLFKIDTGATGLKLWKHPLVRNADAVLLNWVNQGMLSLKGMGKILSLGIPVIWTMHDMWCFTGICHHSGECQRYEKECGQCPLLGSKGASHDLSFKVHRKKSRIYNLQRSSVASPVFVAVSSWLAKRARESSLLSSRKVSVIPNPFHLDSIPQPRQPLHHDDTIRILFGAARLDDSIKGLDVLKEMSSVLMNKYPDIASRLEIVLFGAYKDPRALDGFTLPVKYLGVLDSPSVKEAYAGAHILVSASSYETLPGTLVEAQAYGCIPVAFSRGGQSDIVDHLSTGYLAGFADNKPEAASNLAEGIKWALSVMENPRAYEDIIKKMARNVEEKFSYEFVASRYLSLIRNLQSDK